MGNKFFFANKTLESDIDNLQEKNKEVELIILEKNE